MTREIERAIFDALAHSARRDIIRLTSGREDGISYTEILSELRLSTGRFNYHLKQLEGFIEKNKLLRYQLTPLGKHAFDIMGSLDDEPVDKLEKYVKITKKPALMPALKALAYIQMIVVLAPISFVSYLLFIEITTGGSIEMILALMFFLGVAIAIFTWLGYMVKNAKGFFKYLERIIYDK